MKKITCDGNEACARTSYNFTEIAGIYPITPSSPMAELIDELAAKKEKNLFNDEVKIVEMQSEAGAAGFVHGALQSGVLASTYTASQGLLLMVPNIYKMVGEMLPGVIHVAARSLSTHALSIFGDHQDVYATRMTGITMISSSTVEEAALLSGVSHLTAIKSSLPVLHFFDGFRTSHEISKINILEKEDYAPLLDKEGLNNFRNKALNLNNVVTRGTAQNDDVYFQNTEARNKYHDEVPVIVENYMNEINKIAGTNLKPFVYYGDKKAKKVIVAMGSVVSAIEEVVDDLNKKGEKVGLIKVHLYRPFSAKHLKDAMPKTVKKIAVLDRTKEAGSNGEPLYLDVKNVFNDKFVIGGRYGLSSKDTKPRDIKAVYDALNNKKQTSNFTIGIIDDVTNLSLKSDESYSIKEEAQSYLIYGYGSDGMTSCSKGFIKLVGDLTDKYVQSYARYDSKKSGGVTINNLRISDNKIRSSYYVDEPSFVVCSKENYLDKYDVLKDIKTNGKFLLVGTDKVINKKVIDKMKNKKVEFYMIDAYKLAAAYGLGNKISMIMEAAILKLSNVVEYEKAKEELVHYINKKFYKKGPEVIEKNIQALEKMEEYLIKVELTDLIEKEVLEKEENYIEMINNKKGDLLEVSKFSVDGSIEGGNSKNEKRDVTEKVPFWNFEKCVGCNECSFVCPHGAIRPFIVTKEEVENSPEPFKYKEVLGKEGLYYTIAISKEDCTGCGLCANACPVKGLEMRSILDMKDEYKASSYLFNNIEDKKEFSKFTIKGSQFVKPKFEFSGACAGCGEAPYIKVLTQLFGDEMVIANATGCSSIYGGSYPSTPYSVPWASSLFEDNAEYGYGILNGYDLLRNRIKDFMIEHLEEEKELFSMYLENINDYEKTKEVYEKLDYEKYPALKALKEYITFRSVWTIGGDGWAFDIGYSGLDHIMSTNSNVNVLVLNSEVYSNTGGQSSKASTKGSLAKFTFDGKKTNKKDLARILMSYPNCYVARVSLGYSKQQFLKALKEAHDYNGPSVIICYAPCIAHGIKGGMSNSILQEKMAVKSGYFPIFRYNPSEAKFYLDSKDIDFDLFEEFLMSETRFKMLKAINKEKAEELLNENKKYSSDSYEYYKSLE